MKRILIKAGGIIPEPGKYIAGIGRTNIELISRFAKLKDDEIEFAIYCPTRKSIGFDHYGWDIPYHAYPFPHDALLKSNFESLYRRMFFKYDMLHITGNFDNFSEKENMVVTIHDMYLLNENNKWLFDKCIKKSKAIVTCSDFTKENILELYPSVSGDKITVIPWGIDHGNFYPRDDKEIESLKKANGIKERYFFSCSCSNPRKNADVALEAFAKFCQGKDDVSFVLAWGNPPKELIDKYAKEIADRKIIFLAHVSDNDLAVLYSGAIASIFVSSFEGFGFPILESMACGRPVITCRNSSLPEIGLDLATYVKERDVDELAAAIAEYYNEDDITDVSKLISHAKSYNWDDTVKGYVDFYKRALV